MYKSFKEMPVWIDAMNAAVTVFHITETLPKKEDYGLTSQIRRSALSISANISEAFGRKHTADKVNFYYFARGSITETQSHLEYGKRVGFFNEHDQKVLDEKLNLLYNDINKIIKTLNSK